MCDDREGRREEGGTDVAADAYWLGDGKLSPDDMVTIQSSTDMKQEMLTNFSIKLGFGFYKIYDCSELFNLVLK